MSNPQSIPHARLVATGDCQLKSGREDADHPAKPVHSDDASVSAIRGTLERHGIAFMENLSLDTFTAIMHSMGRVYAHPDADVEGVTRIVPDGRGAQQGGGFTAQPLPLHTDRALTESPPQYLGIYFLSRRRRTGGDPLFCQLDLALSSLTLASLKSLSLRERSGAKQYPLYLGHWANCERFRFRNDAHCDLDGPPQLVKDVEARIASMTIGAPWMATGDAYLLDNTRVLHGRTGFDDPDRSVVRILVEAK